MGPVYSKKAVEKFLRFQTMAHREARQTLKWGKAIENDGGYFVSPGVHHIDKFEPNSAYQGNVLFCPDIAIYDYEVLDQTIAKINNTDAPFVMSFVGDPAIINSRRHLFLAPNLQVNLPTVELEATMPLSGRLNCGDHRFGGAGLSLLLSYPQILTTGTAKDLSDWPWPT